MKEEKKEKKYDKNLLWLALAIIIILVLLGAVLLIFPGPQAPDNEDNGNDDPPQGNNDDPPQGNDDDPPPVDDGQKIEGRYQSFIAYQYENALEQGRPIMLEFYAAWSDVSEQQERANYEAFESSRMPENVIGFKVIFAGPSGRDDDRDIKNEFGVEKEDTRIIIGSDGEIYRTLTGFTDKETLIQLMNEAANR